MLVFSRKEGDAIWIGDNVRVVILRVSGKSTSIGIEASREIKVHRSEIYEKIINASNNDKNAVVDRTTDCY